MDFVRRLLQPVIFFVVIGGIWEFGVRYFEIHPYLLPPVSDILQAGWVSRGELWQHGIVTFWEILIGFAAAVVCGVLVAVCVFFSAVARRTIYPMVTALQSLPKIALAPLMIVWFGYGIMSKLIMTFLFAFFPIVISTLGGLSSTQETLLEHFRALRASPWSTFWRLRVPAALRWLQNSNAISRHRCDHRRVCRIRAGPWQFDPVYHVGWPHRSAVCYPSGCDCSFAGPILGH